ncbi:CcdC family protein [Virgibacillus alimentarius]|uniref:Membrane protein CcdC involved in cytochrome C biogenesis n=1 Tax=Virgibacillus alimentarius TaxID=698769 RepID=A0ABS4S481_9BACI|nr:MULTISPECIES: cytochrome c biogenesis protein CcdC [Virgibacillus]MBP2256290.1 membrane protein CcdC involved in cytochrome C biogenesis [Virgibacillus alimentarius]HLR66235.1 cytochrome c biogenesis protein CcdC [Virgibacillus sp.]
MFWLVTSTVVAAFMATTMIFVRLKAAQKPASVKKIILPPLFMSTGALMFLFPEFQVKWTQVLEAVSVGMIFSILLIKTSRFEIRKQEIYLIPSKAFAFILFGLLLVRVIIKLIIGGSFSLGETSGMFFLLAFGMIITWRFAMLYKYKKLEKELKELNYSYTNN